MIRLAAFALSGLLGFAGAASAAAFDGNERLVCTLDSAAACDTDAQCGGVTHADIDLPDAFGMDFKSHRLRSPDGQRTSPIGAMEVTESALIAQGNQNGRAWSVAIDRASGRMVGTISDPEGAFVLTGSCANEP